MSQSQEFNTEIKRQCASPNPPPKNSSEYKYVASGEVCTIETAKQYGIFGISSYFSSNLSQPDANKTDVLINNVPDPQMQYALCNVKSNNIAYQNCVLTTKNPWKTLNDTKEYCMLPFNIQLPNSLTHKKDESGIIEKPDRIAIWKSKQDYCQEKWYDWFSIPDYHFGNKYSLSSNLQKCLKPCSVGLVPSKKNPDKCIYKDEYKDGYFADTFHYLPISLILLLGSTKETLLEKHISLSSNVIFHTNDAYFDSELYSHIILNRLEDGITDLKLKEKIENNIKTLDNIYNDIKIDLRFHINNLINLPYNDENIAEPFFEPNELEKDPITKTRISDAYKIAQKFYNLSTSPNKINDFESWKKAIADISGYNTNDNKFYKQLLTLKRACNVAFDGKTNYSEKYILYTLNEGAKDGDIKLPINFTIEEKDKIAAISKNTAENVDGNVDATLLKKQEEIIGQNRRKTMKLTTDKMELSDDNYDPKKYETEKLYDVPEKTAGIFTMKNIIMTFIFILLLIVFISVIYILVSTLWEPFSEILNTIILACYYAILYMKDMFKGANHASVFNKELIGLQRNFLKEKILKDRRNFKIL